MLVLPGDPSAPTNGRTIIVTDEAGKNDTQGALLNTRKALFGFGDSIINGTLGGGAVNYIGQNNQPSWEDVGGSNRVPIIRGWKYGLINAVPTSPNAVFRHDTFGQFRDMLEPRLQTRYFEDGDLGESAVTVMFYDRDGTSGAAPNGTNSQNLSSFATSSVPYDDGFAHERTAIQPDLSEATYVTLETV